MERTALHPTGPVNLSASEPPCSKVDLLRKRQRIVHLDTEIPNGALKLSMTQEKLAGSKTARLLVDQRNFGATEAVSSVGARLKPDHCNPIAYQASVLAGAYVIAGATTARKEPVIISPATAREPSFQRFRCRVRNLERNRAARLLLNDVRPLPHGASWRDIAYP
jgi:hypothetical protein